MDLASHVVVGSNSIGSMAETGAQVTMTRRNKDVTVTEERDATEKNMTRRNDDTQHNGNT